MPEQEKGVREPSLDEHYEADRPRRAIPRRFGGLAGAFAGIALGDRLELTTGAGLIMLMLVLFFVGSFAADYVSKRYWP